MNINSKDAEQAVLGCLIRQPADATRVRARIGVDDFTGFEQRAWTVFVNMVESGAHIDPVTYRQALQDSRALPAVETAAYVAGKLIEAPWSISAVGHYAEIVHEASRRRRLAELGTRIHQQAENPATDIDRIALDGMVNLEQIVGGADTEDLTAVDLEDFMTQVEPEPDWLIPGLIARGDRTLITAGEGVGKSMITRQLCLCAAAGMHPFTFARIEPRRVLIVDCENNARQTRMNIAPIANIIEGSGFAFDRRLSLRVRPEGLDLTRPADAGWLLRLAEKLQPDILAVGPLYRLHNANPNDEGPARAVAAALDAVRIRADCSLITECHAGHGPSGAERELRPYGSSLWRRWPETIRALRPVADQEGSVDRTRVEVETAGRFDRDPRDWPHTLQWGGRHTLPWVVPAYQHNSKVA